MSIAQDYRLYTARADARHRQFGRCQGVGVGLLAPQLPGQLLALWRKPAQQNTYIHQNFVKTLSDVCQRQQDSVTSYVTVLQPYRLPKLRKHTPLIQYRRVPFAMLVVRTLLDTFTVSQQLLKSHRDFRTEHPLFIWPGSQDARSAAHGCFCRVAACQSLFRE